METRCPENTWEQNCMRQTLILNGDLHLLLTNPFDKTYAYLYEHVDKILCTSFFLRETETWAN